MDATKVHFDNPAWQTFMARVLNEVCMTLGVNAAASQPRCELYKLLLYESGSQYVLLIENVFVMLTDSP